MASCGSTWIKDLTWTTSSEGCGTKTPSSRSQDVTSVRAPVQLVAHLHGSADVKGQHLLDARIRHFSGRGHDGARALLDALHARHLVHIADELVLLQDDFRDDLDDVVGAEEEQLRADLVPHDCRQLVLNHGVLQGIDQGGLAALPSVEGLSCPPPGAFTTRLPLGVLIKTWSSGPKCT